MEWEGEKRTIETKELLGKKLAILGFDSCVMGMLEVGYQFERVAETMIVSEGSVPSAGWTYAKLLGCLTREDGTKIAGHEGTKIAGHEGTKLAGGGSSAFFNSLQLFKNIESRWDISGFTKKPDEAQLADD